MAAKKNKKSKKPNKKPAVGSPAAGSNNKRAKNNNNNSNQKQGKVQNNNKNSNQRPAPMQEPAKQQKPVKPQKPVNPQKPVENKKPVEKQKPVNQPKAEKTGRKRKAAKGGKKRSSFKRFAAKYNIGKIVLAALLALGIIAAVVYLIVRIFTGGVKVPDEIKNAEYKGRLEASSVAVQTDISEEQQKILARSLSVKGDKSAFKFFVNKDIVMDDYSDPALIEFGSVSSNDCILLAFLVDENGNLLYRSLGVEPGEKISSVSLFDSVPYGKHKLTLFVNGYDPETKEIVGTQAATVNLKIGS